jgi:hypothetical protein
VTGPVRATGLVRVYDRMLESLEREVTARLTSGRRRAAGSRGTMVG